MYNYVYCNNLGLVIGAELVGRGGGAIYPLAFTKRQMRVETGGGMEGEEEEGK